jgi:hypothetical protein
MAVPARRIVEHFDVVEDVRARQITGPVDARLDAFFFWAAEERLGDDWKSTSLREC